jgi:hypothetical protein
MQPASRPPWAISTNQELFGDVSEPSVSSIPQSALIVIEGLHCGSSVDEAYLAKVSWVTTEAEVNSVRVEYEIRSGSSSSSSIIVDPVVAAEMEQSAASGAMTIGIPESEIKSETDIVLVQLIVKNSVFDEIVSPVDEYVVGQICSLSDEG